MKDGRIRNVNILSIPRTKKNSKWWGTKVFLYTNRKGKQFINQDLITYRTKKLAKGQCICKYT